jgi:hypothetical protein
MMSFFKKKVWVKPFPERLAKRVARIPTGELEQWIDQSLTEIGKCINMYTKSRDKVYLEEALKGAEAMHAVVEELHSRMTR